MGKNIQKKISIANAVEVEEKNMSEIIKGGNGSSGIIWETAMRHMKENQYQDNNKI